MQIEMKFSKVPLVKVISSEIMYSGNHFSGCNNNFSSEAFLEIFTSVRAPNSLYLTEVQCRSLKFMNRYGSTTFYKGETVSDIRERAPKTFTSQYRLINSTDYENY